MNEYSYQQIAAERGAALRREACLAHLAALATCCRPSAWRTAVAAARTRLSWRAAQGCCA